MSLDKSAVRSIAELARIEVPEEELDHLAGELSNILTFVEQLAEANTEGVSPMTSVVHMALPARDDVVTDGGYPDKVLVNAPDAVILRDAPQAPAQGGFFTVPKVVE